MGDPLTGVRIVTPETRELFFLTSMFAERGAVPIPCPLVAIKDAPDQAPIEAWLRRFVARPCDDLILLTGEGLRRLADGAERMDMKAPFVAALASARKITRGPKPARALREIGLEADLPALVPTSAGVVDALAPLDLSGRRIGVQIYPEGDHQPLLGFLAKAGAQTDVVSPYVYASEAEDGRVLAVIEQMAAGEADAIAFTSSSQVRRFYAVAAKAGRSEAARQGLAHVVVAAIGPVVARELAAHGARVDVTPANEAYFMRPLVRELGAAFAARGTGKE